MPFKPRKPFVHLAAAACGSMFSLLVTASAQDSRPVESPAPKATSSSTVAYTNSMEVLDDKRRLSIGDQVSFRIVEDHKDLTRLIVTDSGEMEVPLIGRVSAKGKTCKELAVEIKKLLEVDYFFRCTVILGLDAAGKRSRGTVYVTGQVRGQGSFELPADEPFTVSKAILKAGGFADFANRKKVRIVRKNGPNGSQTLFSDLVQILEKGHLEKDLELEPDDIVIVPERLINF